ncbi:hypothetical protein L5515_018590 [Caenorhabditis briggsae]|uniref:Uncharacterized protein n=3 Tax=Caenorhabditis briggsae TaxID=6238 RepID=A0AAE9JS39_CAEBR|nr:hypothetical protein L5515_018590 [Caenorhabditis briggsae]
MHYLAVLLIRAIGTMMDRWLGNIRRVITAKRDNQQVPVQQTQGQQESSEQGSSNQQESGQHDTAMQNFSDLKADKEKSKKNIGPEAHKLNDMIVIVAAFLETGKFLLAIRYCSTIVETAFDKNDPQNPYRLLFLSFLNLAQLESKFYDFNIFQQKSESLKVAYSRCQQSFMRILQMESTHFKSAELLNAADEFARFTCFRQCHVNILKYLANLDENETMDWFDVLKSLDSNILAMINDSDISLRLCKTDKEKKEFEMSLHKIQKDELASNDQFCFSWLKNLRYEEIYHRTNLTYHIYEIEPAYRKFWKKLKTDQTDFLINVVNRKEYEVPYWKLCQKQPVEPRRFGPKNTELEDREETEAKKCSSSNDSGFADNEMVVRRKPINKAGTQNMGTYSTDTEDLNYSAVFPGSDQSFTTFHADALRRKLQRKQMRLKYYNDCASEDCRKRVPEHLRRKIRIMIRNSMAEAREICIKEMRPYPLLEIPFHASDDENSDDETAPKVFTRTETEMTVRNKKMKQFGLLDPYGISKPVLWWKNAKEELLAARAIESSCLKMNGESSEPFASAEKYRGFLVEGEHVRNRVLESQRTSKCRVFNFRKEMNVDDGMLLTMPAMDPFKDIVVPRKRSEDRFGLKSLFLQNLRRRCVDELLMLMMIIKGHQQLQEGNFFRCLAYVKLLEFKMTVYTEEIRSEEVQKTNFFSYLMHIYKLFLGKYTLYARYVVGPECMTRKQLQLMKNESDYSLAERCFEFCKNTDAYFFCIVIRGRLFCFEEDQRHGLPPFEQLEEYEEQLEFFLSLDSANKNMGQYWRSQVKPLIQMLVQMHDNTLLDHIDKWDGNKIMALVDKFPMILPNEKNWLRRVATYATNLKEGKAFEEAVKDPFDYNLPILFQLPFYANGLATKFMIRGTTEFIEDAVTSFVGRGPAPKNEESSNIETCYDSEIDCTLFGKSIEKDIYMVSVHDEKPTPFQTDKIHRGLRKLSKTLKSQNGFNYSKQFHA